MRTTIALAILAIPLLAASDEAGSWSPKGAASYLDQRADWWIGWKNSARDHGTFCISCHTALPYALGRPSLRSALNESAPSKSEQQLLDNVTKRVRIWSEALPFYNDEKSGAGKTAEARSMESVLNAVRQRDALLGHAVQWARGSGTVAGIDGDGRLLVESEAGTVALDAGEVHLAGG